MLALGITSCGSAAALRGAQSHKADPAKRNRNFILSLHGSGCGSQRGGWEEDGSSVGRRSLAGAVASVLRGREPPGLLLWL